MSTAGEIFSRCLFCKELKAGVNLNTRACTSCEILLENVYKEMRDREMLYPTCHSCKSQKEDVGIFTRLCGSCYTAKLEESYVEEEQKKSFIDELIERKKAHKKERDVQKPDHYQGHGLEAIDVIEAFELNFRLGNALEYILRAGKKEDAVRDLKKAIWYLNREIEKISGT